MTLKGLTDEQAELRLKKDGPNEVASHDFNFGKSVLSRLWEPSAWILEVALIIEIVLGKTIQAGFIVLMLLFAAINGAVQEGRASRVLGKLSKQLSLTSRVIRSDKWISIPSRALVVGDIIDLHRGNLIPADAQLLDSGLEVDESSITGESTAVTKSVKDNVYAGTEILKGNSMAEVIATGARSRSGKTVNLATTSSAPGHLQQLLSRIIGYLAILDTVLAVVILITSFIRGESSLSMVPFLGMLFIATIPIAMPSSFSVANAVEARVLSDEDILVSNLTGIQEAGNLNILLVDKTGTITENQTKVVSFLNTSQLSDYDVLYLARQATDYHQPSVVDTAVQSYTEKMGQYNALDFKPFDPSLGYSEAIVNTSQKSHVIRLGSLKRLVDADTIESAKWRKQLNTGRSLAVTDDDELIGIFILRDAPRNDSRASILEIQRRGVRVMMLTGDNAVTAQQVAREVGLKGDIIASEDFQKMTDFSKVAGIAGVLPEDKLAIVEKLQVDGYVVGMTGDGINDAPALKRAEVGVAVANAADLAKKSAKIILMKTGLSSFPQILDSGHRVYQRMMTWTITKLARTAELTLMLTFGYLVFKQIPLSLNAMVLVAILNDLVTLVLGTDNTTISYKPEQWNFRRLSSIAGILTVGWTVTGIAMLTWLHQSELAAGQISSAMYVFLIASAMLTILMTRTKSFFWSSRPSKWVVTAIALNLFLTLVLSVFGLGIAAISIRLIIKLIILVLVVGVLLDCALVWFYSKRNPRE
ncbi:HAD-IC family P-type ATPase [Levilactobacillus brevis]|uniref:E1-E2 ATPase n=1 Tax=Levilactobacillus brevis ATCC 14869 = DSM 20054 TaxID=649758 RepID=U2NU20_LEVBR|nr:HAD-IC family P-type ATPase [Levilactobacillus brevis]ERK41505.1 e1-E2 ATPase [Levilactobacillus brevis ATCC 14869 = DSM 20054]KIO98779.1 hypothetical protein QP38_1468 [Levilactobacillus brevis]KRK20432.1 cadmium- manganese-transporting P-type ATPase [Levilactobacillus brevis ATCC 14869 = DSM 20054]MCT3571285.1 HAD family hydrolase [Levilactobacillus brevis]MCT3572195.1 HAD family hydrolase [Levilactobacillus brevis]